MGRAFEYRRAAKEKRWDKMSKVFPKLSKAITVAAKEGGSDPEMNFKLRAAIQNAKAENMPKDNIESAIKRASDKELKDLSSRFTYLEKEAGRSFDVRELESMTRDVVMSSFGEGLTLGRTTKLEQGYAGQFRALYESEEWLFAKSERTLLQPILRNGDTVGYGRSKAVGGLIRATLALRKNKIIKAIINGDWHPRPLESVSWLEEQLIGVEAEFEVIRAKIQQFLADDEVEFAGVKIEDLMSAIKVALETQDVR